MLGCDRHTGDAGMHVCDQDGMQMRVGSACMERVHG